MVGHDMLPKILTQLTLAFGSLTETLLVFYARLVGWNPAGCSISLTVTEGEPEIYGVTVTGVIRLVNNVVVIELNKPWHYPNRTTSVTDLVLVQPRFTQHSVYRLLLGSWHCNVYAVVDINKPTVATDANGIAICVARLLR